MPGYCNALGFFLTLNFPKRTAAERILLLVLPIWLCPLGNLLANEAPQPSVERASTLIEAKGRPIRIVNPFGDVRLRHGGDKGVIEVAAVIQHLEKRGWLALEFDQSGDTVGISAIRKSKATLDSGDSEPESDKARCDLAVLVPSGSDVYVETTGGLVEARGVRVNLDLNTKDGPIVARKNRGAIQAHSVHGDITVLLEENITDQDQTMQSVTGDISILVSPHEKMTVEMATSEDLITHFSIQVTPLAGQEPNKRGISDINGGGKRLSLFSKRGDAALRSGPTVRKVGQVVQPN